jgi:hypothetical protein
LKGIIERQMGAKVERSKLNICAPPMSLLFQLIYLYGIRL